MIAKVNNDIKKLALGLEYDGSAYFGWQHQPKLPSIQRCLEVALSTVANENITVHCASRTDAGVHATEQIVHFSTKAHRSYSAWTMGVNSNLPMDIAVRWVTSVASNFHARYSATARKYRYIIYNHNLRSALFNHRITHYYRPLNVPLMVRASQCLLGENDFTSFRATQCQSRSPFRNVKNLEIVRKGRYVIIDIKANAFVCHMVRNIVGSLLVVGSGDQPESWISELLLCRDRTKAGATAPAKGLYLTGIEYSA